ncbi:MAG: hypothetical protein CSA40_01655 [Flavobacteriales bacterium]|nr:MAG: hypothetical protein CSA40_01655 [Flavobacteriales bacterium]
MSLIICQLSLKKVYTLLILIGLLFGGYRASMAQIKLTRDSIAESPSEKMLQPQDTITKDSTVVDSMAVTPVKETLKDIITHTSEDKKIINYKANTTTLYNNAKITYEDVVLEAGIIVIDYKNNTLKATGIKDSLGYSQLPYFKQGQEETTQDSLIVNYDTEKAIVFGMKTQQQGDLIVYSKLSKKENDSTLFVRDIKVTTSQKKEPDYDIRIRKAKIIPNKKIIARSAQLYIENMPTVAWIPFAYFPDYVDLALTGDIYTNGSWALQARSNYALRYKFRGNVGFTYDNNIYSLKGFDDYSKSSQYNIRWSHSQDASANPNARLSASVNMGSSKYYRKSLNEFNTNNFLKNTLNSSISFSKRFNGTPFNMSLSATHSQNTNTEQIRMSLPSLQLSMDRIYPLAPKNGAKKNAFHKLGLSYNMSANYQINTTDDNFFTQKMFEGSKKGVQHRVALGTNMKVLKYFTLNPNASYREIWNFDYLNKYYDDASGMVVSDSLQGFKATREYNTGMSLSTNIYGTFPFKKGRLKAIRHTMRPSVSYTYRPDFSFYDEEYYDPDQEAYVSYSPYQLGLYGTPSSGISNNLSFSLNNVFEAKVKPKDDPEAEPEKITLLNNLRLTTSYNMTKDSLRWSPVGLSANTNFFNDKLRVNVNATLNPYAINANGSVVDMFNIENGGSLFRLTRAGLRLNYSLTDKTFQKDAADDDKESSGTDVDEEAMMGGDLKDTGGGKKSGKKKSNKQKFSLYHVELPFNLNLSYSLQYTNNRRENRISNHSLMFNGDIDLTPKWNVGFSSGYDFKNKGITYTQLSFKRDLDSWRMSFSWVPIGERRTYYFFIGVKSSILSDLKYDKQSLPDKQLF